MSTDWEKEANLQYRLHNEMIEEARKYRDLYTETLAQVERLEASDAAIMHELNDVDRKLAIAVEALEDIRTGKFGKGMYVEVATKALQSIKGSEPYANG